MLLPFFLALGLFAALASILADVIRGGNVIPGAQPRTGSLALASDAGTPAVGGAIKSLRVRYDFAVKGGAVGTIPLFGASLIPAGAVVIGGIVDVITPPTSGGAGTLGIGVEAGADIVAAAAVSGAPWSTTGRKSTIPAFTGATSIKTTVARDVNAIIATAALTAGVVDVYLFYVETA